MAHRAILIPGFFGFQRLGGLRYFVGVSEHLTAAFKRRGEELHTFEVTTMPTASIRHRAARVRDVISHASKLGDGPIHLIGHSTGGLDARLAITPNASLPTQYVDTSIDRVASLVAVSTPHYGTPLASFFAGAAGQPLLRLIAATSALMLQHGRIPMAIAVRLGEMFKAMAGAVGLRSEAIDGLYDTLLQDFPEPNRRALVSILEEVAADASLVFQLTSEAVDVLNAATANPQHIRYGSVVTCAKTPSVTRFPNLIKDPIAPSLYILFGIVHGLAGRGNPPAPSAAFSRAFRSAGLSIPTTRSSDGVVPTLSQCWGDPIHVASADHLDIVGHLGKSNKSVDWIPSQSGFTSGEFEATWDQVAEYLLS